MPTVKQETKFKRVLRRIGMSQKDASDKTGISRVTINHYARGKTRPRKLELKRLEELLGVKASELFPAKGGDDG